MGPYDVLAFSPSPAALVILSLCGPPMGRHAPVSGPLHGCPLAMGGVGVDLCRKSWHVPSALSTL